MRPKKYTDKMIIDAIFKAKTMRGAAALLGCSPAYISMFCKRPENLQYRIWGTQGVDMSKISNNVKGVNE